MARAGLPTANPPPAAVARMPDTNANTSGYIDWEARRAEQAANTPDRLEDNPLGRYLLDIERRRILQEAIDRQAAASSLIDAHTKESEEDVMQDLEIDINDIDRQRSEYQRLQAEKPTGIPLQSRGTPMTTKTRKCQQKKPSPTPRNPRPKRKQRSTRTRRSQPVVNDPAHLIQRQLAQRPHRPLLRQQAQRQCPISYPPLNTSPKKRQR